MKKTQYELTAEASSKPELFLPPPVIAGMGNSGLLSQTQAVTKNTSSKNILVISAISRTNSNSDAFCDEFMRGALQAGHESDKNRLSEKTINYCTRCLTCIDNFDDIISSSTKKNLT